MSEPILTPELLTERQVAQILGVSTRTVQKLASEGKLRRIPIGTKLTPQTQRRPGHIGVRYRRRDVLRLVETGWVW